MFEDVKESNIEDEVLINQDSKYHFFYNREERIKNAPQIVKDYYDGKMKPVRGIKVLVANKSNRSILLALIFFVAVTWIYSAFNKSRNYIKLNDIGFEMNVFAYGEEVYTSVEVKRNKNAKNIKPEKIQMEFFFINSDNQTVFKEEQFMIYEKGEDFFRTKIIDYDIIRVDGIVSINGKDKELSAFVKR